MDSIMPFESMGPNSFTDSQWQSSYFITSGLFNMWLSEIVPKPVVLVRLLFWAFETFPKPMNIFGNIDT